MEQTANMHEVRNECFASFCKRYENFINKKASQLVEFGAFSAEEAIQEMHLLIWEAITDKNFDPFAESTDAWIYQRILFRNGRKAERNKKVSSTEIPVEIIHDIHGESDTSPHSVFGQRYSNTESKVEALSWIERALQEAEKLPKKQKMVVSAWLQPAELLEYSSKRTVDAVGVLVDWQKEIAARYIFATHLLDESDPFNLTPSVIDTIHFLFDYSKPSDAWDGRKQGRDFEVASVKDLQDFTGLKNADKLLKSGVAKIVEILGHPFDNHKPNINHLHPASFESSEATRSNAFVRATEIECLPVTQEPSLDVASCEEMWKGFFRRF